MQCIESLLTSADRRQPNYASDADDALEIVYLYIAETTLKKGKQEGSSRASLRSMQTYLRVCIHCELIFRIQMQGIFKSRRLRNADARYIFPAHGQQESWRQIIQPSFERITLLVLICLVCPIRSLDPVMAFCACRCIVRRPLTQDMSLRPRGPLRHSELFDSDSQPYSPLFVLLIEAITYPMRPHWRRK